MDNKNFGNKRLELWLEFLGLTHEDYVNGKVKNIDFSNFINKMKDNFKKVVGKDESYVLKHPNEFDAFLAEYVEKNKGIVK